MIDEVKKPVQPLTDDQVWGSGQPQPDLPTVAELVHDFQAALERPDDPTPTWSHVEVALLLNALTHERAKVLNEAAEELRRFSIDEAQHLDQSARNALFRAGKALLELERKAAAGSAVKQEASNLPRAWRSRPSD